MVIEVVAAEIGERRGGQRHAFAAMLVEAVGRRFVSDMADAHALEPRHVVEEGDDVGGGQPGLDLVVAGGHAQASRSRPSDARSCATSGASFRPSRSCRWSRSPRPPSRDKARRISRRARRSGAAARDRRYAGPAARLASGRATTATAPRSTASPMKSSPLNAPRETRRRCCRARPCDDRGQSRSPRNRYRCPRDRAGARRIQSFASRTKGSTWPYWVRGSWRGDAEHRRDPADRLRPPARRSSRRSGSRRFRRWPWVRRA